MFTEIPWPGVIVGMGGSTVSNTVVINYKVIIAYDMVGHNYTHSKVDASPNTDITNNFHRKLQLYKT